MTQDQIAELLDALWEFSLKIDQKEYHGSLFTYNVTHTLTLPFWKPE